MRACATASAVLIGFVLTATLFAACTTLQPGSQPPDNTPSEPHATSPGSESGAKATGSITGTSILANTAAPAVRKKAPETAADCKELLTEFTNDPPSSGVVMNNAATAGDAGSSDRLQPILDMVKSRRDSFRCCFDVYARKHPGAHGRLAFTMRLAQDGALLEGHIKNDESDVTAPEIESCMVELAKSISWPQSPSGKETTYTHRFDFKSLR